jgi:hypothetical protein
VLEEEGVKALTDLRIDHEVLELPAHSNRKMSKGREEDGSKKRIGPRDTVYILIH